MVWRTTELATETLEMALNSIAMRKFVVTLALCLAAAPSAFRHEAAAQEFGYAVKVTDIRLSGRSVTRTDAAVHKAGEELVELRAGDEFRRGEVLLVYYPALQIRLTGSGGDVMVLQCTDCTRDEPLELTVGDPESGKPFVQRGGDVHYRIDSDGGWFEILLDVLGGPEERLVPIGVRGTVFAVEKTSTGYSVTVAEGLVEVGGGAVGFSFSPGVGQRVLMGTKGAALEAALPENLLRIFDLLAPAGPVGTIAPPVSQPSSSPWPWVTVAAGVATAAAGGVVHYLAWDHNRSAQSTANDLCAGAVGRSGPPTAESGSEFYDRKYEDQVAPEWSAAQVLYSAGAAAVAGGLVWYFLETLSGDGAVVRPSVVVPGTGLSPTSKSLLLELSF